MCLITDKDVVVKRILKSSLICSYPCWLLWVKARGGSKAVNGRLVIIDYFRITGSVKLIMSLPFGSHQNIVFKKPLRFKKGIYCYNLGAFASASFAYIPDY